MIDRKQAEQAGFKTVDAAVSVASSKQTKLDQVRDVLPALVSDGMLNSDALRGELGIENYAPTAQGYGLNFAGKGLARIQADEATSKELRVERGQSKLFDKTNNTIVRGDSLDVLKILRQNYEGRVTMIYIDPPYNTDNAHFIYEDSFRETEADLIEKYGLSEEDIQFFESIVGTKTHSGWLFAMYPRLTLARDLLSDDGVIFISIDENEQANLKIMCDEIFGSTNFVAGLVHQKKSGGGQAKYYYKGHDHILVYSKNIDSVEGLRKRDDKVLKTTVFNGEEVWYETDVVRRAYGKYDSEDGHRNLFYEDMDEETKKGYDEDLAQEKYILVKDEASGKHLIAKFGPKGAKEKILYSILFSDQIYKIWTSDGDKRLSELFGISVFSNPKPVDLIKLLMHNHKSGIVLDFFAGSGTTGDAVMQLNAEDQGKRQFILVQLDEAIDSVDWADAHEFCKKHEMAPVISSICIERINRAGDKIKAEKGVEAGLDVGYKVFSLTEKPRVVEGDDGQLRLGVSRQSTEDTLHNMMAASGEVPLTAPIETIEVGSLYKVRDSYFVLGECQADLREISANSRLYIDGYADIGLLQWLNALGLDKDLVKILY